MVKYPLAQSQPPIPGSESFFYRLIKKGDNPVKASSGHSPPVSRQPDALSCQTACSRSPLDSFLSSVRFRAAPFLFAGGSLFFLCFSFALITGCANVTDDDWGGRSNEDVPEGLISDYNLQHYVPVPANGGTPVKSYTFQDKVEVSVVWMDETGADISESLKSFKAEVYQANITLRTKEGYTFNTEKVFSYPKGAVTTQPVSNPDRSVWELSGVVYKQPAKQAKVITDFNLKGYIDDLVEKNHALPPVVKKSQYTGEIEWVKVAYSETRWNAMIFLYASPGYYFTEQAFSTANNVLPSYIDKHTILLKMVFNDVPEGITIGDPEAVPPAPPDNPEDPPDENPGDIMIVVVEVEIPEDD
jgi:hypothetical protein